MASIFEKMEINKKAGILSVHIGSTLKPSSLRSVEDDTADKDLPADKQPDSRGSSSSG